MKFLTILTALTLLGCTSIEENISLGADVTEVRAAVRAFQEAEIARDADLLVSFLDDEFYMYQDGSRAERSAVVAQIRSTMPTIERFETQWHDIEVMPLGGSHALVSMRFSDHIVFVDGGSIRHQGPNTFVWVLRGDGWKILYVDADHYPLETNEEAASPEPVG